jgi:hypothetical protein
LYIDIFPKTVTYSTYQNIQINYTLNIKQYGNWTFSWKHYWNGVVIRTLKYTITDNIAVLDLPFSDYADNGEYTCTLHVNGGEFVATGFVHVHGVVFTFLPDLQEIYFLYCLRWDLGIRCKNSYRAFM